MVRFLPVLPAAFAGALLLSPAQDPPTEWTKVELTHKVIGFKSCADCHDKKTSSKAMEKWSSGPHAKAYEALGSERAGEIAQARGIEDPQKSPECLKCHTVGYGNAEEWFGKRFTLEEGVSCEACHGAGDDYQPKAVHSNPRRRAEAIEKGFVIPTEATCLNCHNAESPTWAGVPFDTKARRKQIMHWKPRDIDK